MLSVSDILTWLDLYAPFRFAASWDNCGLQVGSPSAPVKRILVSLDPTSGTLSEAERLECQCLVTHHPLLFRPLNAVRADQFPGNLVISALLKDIHLIAAHTNLDVAQGGTNEKLGELLSLNSIQPLECDDSNQGADRYRGMGLVGFLTQRMTFKALLDKTTKVFGTLTVRAVGDAEKPVRRIALCSGSGSSLIERAIGVGSDVFITGDIKYHDAQRALEAGMALIDIGHFASERIVVGPLAAFIRAQAASHGESLEVFESMTEKDPFWHPSIAENP
jgi:dinuclear metal center YbgI/SA1388 family protein